MGFIRTLLLHRSYAGASFHYFVSDTIYSPLFSMHGLDDKVAHVSHVRVRSLARVSAYVRCIGRPAFPAVDDYLAPGPASVGWAPGSAPSALDPSSLLSCSAHSAADGGRRRRFSGMLRLLSLSLLFGPGFGFCGTTLRPAVPVFRVCTSRLGRRGFLSLQTTFPMN